MRDVCISGLVPGVPVTRIRTRFAERARVYVIVLAHIYIIGLSTDETSRFGASERNIIVSFENERVDCRNDLFALNMTRNSHELPNTRRITFFKDLA